MCPANGISALYESAEYGIWLEPVMWFEMEYVHDGDQLHTSQRAIGHHDGSFNPMFEGEQFCGYVDAQEAAEIRKSKRYRRWYDYVTDEPTAEETKP